MKNPIRFTLREGEEFIPLVQLLKATNVAGTGGEAQFLVLDGTVRLNGEVEFRKRAKIRPGDTVHCRGVDIEVEFNPASIKD